MKFKISFVGLLDTAVMLVKWLDVLYFMLMELIPR